MKSSGTKTAMRNQVFNKTLILFFIFISFANAKDCSSLKNAFLTSSYSESDLREIQTGIEADNICLKNVMGIMLYKGIYFKKDKDRAEKIFYDLSNKNYPEAQFNFAWAMSERGDQKPLDVISLLLGIYSKYLTDQESAHLSIKARKLGYAYIDELKATGSLNSPDLNELISKYDASIKNTNDQFTLLMQQRMAQARSDMDNIVALAYLGMFAYKLGGMVPSNAGSSATNIAASPNPWFNYGQGFGNPLNLYQFHL